MSPTSNSPTLLLACLVLAACGEETATQTLDTATDAANEVTAPDTVLADSDQDLGTPDTEPEPEVITDPEPGLLEVTPALGIPLPGESIGFSVRNPTSSRVAIERVDLLGSTDSPWTGPSGVLSPPLILSPGESVEWTTSATGVVKFIGARGVVLGELALAHTTHADCLVFGGPALHFGGVVVGESATRELTVTSCADVEQALELTIERSDFALVGDAQATLAPGATASFQVRYTPSAEVLNALTPVARMLAGRAYPLVSVSGYPMSSACHDTQIWTSSTGLLGAPVQLVSSSRSTSPIASWRWTVLDPTGAPVTVSDPTQSAPTFTPTVYGLHEVSLEVVDTNGVPSCTPATTLFNLVAPPDFVIRLTWTVGGESLPSSGQQRIDADVYLAGVSDALTWFADSDADGLPDGWKLQDRFSWETPSLVLGQVVIRVDAENLTPDESIEVWKARLPYKTLWVGVHAVEDLGRGPFEMTVVIESAGETIFEQTHELANKAFWTVTRLDLDPYVAPVAATVCAGTLETCSADTDCGGAACGAIITPEATLF